MKVEAWIEKVMIPTYKTGCPEKNPMFLEKRVYQGSSGVVYPHPVIEKIEDEKMEQEYTAVFLENEYLRIMILPELGGRIQRAYDKVRNRDFVYYNQVIKPALVGLAGPWISGGIEFNWPQHHRPSTYSPVDHTIEEFADGSKTVWVNETELMFRTKGMAGFTLYPGKAYLEIKGRVFNRTPFPQTFLWWANPAVKVNEHYQSIFPPDVYAVYDHGKRDVSDFPIATGTYYKVDYSPGTDISRYDNIPVPTSYMAIRSGYDFMGCYEHDTQAGMLHVADHHLSPGKKQWTWGNGDFGFAWDRNLTDEDGPYIELMTGVFTDNQPDFSWLQPNEQKTFEQYFMPYAAIGAVKNATREALLNMEAEGNTIRLMVYATSIFQAARVELMKGETRVREFIVDLSPASIFSEYYSHDETIDITEWRMIVRDASGQELVSWQPEKPESKEIPAAATAAKLPEEIEQIEELYLNGLHLEQYRHATFHAMDYYEEALRRSPGDARCNNAKGLLLLRRGQFAGAEPYFRKAIATLTGRNPNPYDGEAHYNLGWSLKLQGKIETAYEAFYKSTWNDAWQHSGFLSLARIASQRGDWAMALAHIEKSLIRNYHSQTARHLKAALLRKAGRMEEAIQLINESIRIDPFNTGCLWEQRLISLHKLEDERPTLGRMQLLMRDYLNNYLELALDYAQAGLFNDAIALLEYYVDGKTTVEPIAYYYLAWLATEAGNPTIAASFYRLASKQPDNIFFPNKIEEISVLQSALAYNPTDSLAAYWLGNLWYDKRQYAEAISCWEQSLHGNRKIAAAYRNLSLAYFNKLNRRDDALAMMEQAFALDNDDARILMELDQLSRITGRGPEERISYLERYPQLIEQRDDLWLEHITLKNSLGRFDEARLQLATRMFHPWEGGEGKVVGQYLLCHTELAKQAIHGQKYQEAIDLLMHLQEYPANLGEGKLLGTQENDIHFLLGYAYECQGKTDRALAEYRLATSGISDPVQAIYYNDPQPDKIVYQALAWTKLGRKDKAEEIFQKFIAFGETHLNDKITIDYFAVSLPDMLVFDIDLDQRNKWHCQYLIGLGHLGLGDESKGVKILRDILEENSHHQGAFIQLNMLPFFRQSSKQYSVT